jgi:tRNA pseudouridine32 synthase / 23S rRNA pseudouridine746 synthase
VNLSPNYWYTGIAPDRGELLQLPRTQEVEAIALDLMAHLAQNDVYDREGKMYGVLLAESANGERVVLKAFSGLLNGAATIVGWVPPIPGRESVAAAEAETLAALAAMKQELIELDRLPERERYRILTAEYSDRLSRLAIEHRQRKEWRERERERLTTILSDTELATALEELAAQSRQDGRERRHLKQERDEVLQPIAAIVERIETRMRELKQQRKIRSRQLQTQLHDAYRLMNFLGTSTSLRELMPAGIPTGTGDCCAPKLLHYAATHQLKPIAMAEFWWGENTADKRQGEFYGACAERCQPLMGFMLSGVTPRDDAQLPIVYEDEHLIAINKPTGLLSVPGRYLDRQDSVLTRMQQLYPTDDICPVHRLDRDTSGILLLARDRATFGHLTQQFHDRQIQKVYTAILAGKLDRDAGSIDLPLWGDPHNRPMQIVDFDRGKPSLTKFQVLEIVEDRTRIEFIPVTGRTHQLRVHAADPLGLGIPILGDRLYGCKSIDLRLHLHARSIAFTHPINNQIVRLQIDIPF